jgi:hypothetical protein
MLIGIMPSGSPESIPYFSDFIIDKGDFRSLKTSLYPTCSLFRFYFKIQETLRHNLNLHTNNIPIGGVNSYLCK